MTLPLFFLGGQVPSGGLCLLGMPGERGLCCEPAVAAPDLGSLKVIVVLVPSTVVGYGAAVALKRNNSIFTASL